MDKASYIKAVLLYAPADERLMDAAVYFYHAGIPLTDAKQYMQTLATKLKRK